MAKAPIDSTKKQEADLTTTEQKPTAVVAPATKAKVKEPKAEVKAEVKAEAPADKNLIKKEGDPMPAMAVTNLPGYEITEVTFDQLKSVMLEKLKSKYRFRLGGSRTESENVFDSFFKFVGEKITDRYEETLKFFKAHDKVNDNVIYFDSTSVLISTEDSPFYTFGCEGDGDSFDEKPSAVLTSDKRYGNFSLVISSRIEFEKMSGVNLICSVSSTRDSVFVNSVVIPSNYYPRPYGSKEYVLSAGRVILKESIFFESKNVTPNNLHGSIIARKSVVKKSTLPANFDMRAVTMDDCMFPHSDGSFEYCTLKNISFSTYKYRSDQGSGVSINGSRDKRLTLSNASVGEDERTLTLPHDSKRFFRSTFFGLSHPMHLATFNNAFLKAEQVNMAHTVDDGMVLSIMSMSCDNIRGGVYISQKDSAELIRAKITSLMKGEETPVTEQQGLLLPLQQGLTPLNNPFDRRFDEPLQRTIDSLTEVVASRLNIYRMLTQLGCN